MVLAKSHSLVKSEDLLLFYVLIVQPLLLQSLQETCIETGTKPFIHY